MRLDGTRTEGGEREYDGLARRGVCFALSPKSRTIVCQVPCPATGGVTCV